MPKANIEAPDWLRHTESILEEMNEGVAIVDDQLSVVFANEALLRLGQYERATVPNRFSCRQLKPETPLPGIGVGRGVRRTSASPRGADEERVGKQPSVEESTAPQGQK